jgi:hypothetical protein
MLKEAIFMADPARRVSRATLGNGVRRRNRRPIPACTEWRLRSGCGPGRSRAGPQPQLSRGLGRLDSLLSKGRAYAEVEDIGPEEILEVRLAPDMLTWRGRCSARATPPNSRWCRAATWRTSASPTTSELRGPRRPISRTQSFLAAEPRAAIDRRDEAATIGRTPATVSARDYALCFGLPNFLFHATMA